MDLFVVPTISFKLLYGLLKIPAEIIERFRTGQSTGQPAGYSPDEAFGRDALGALFEQIARRKLAARKVSLIKRLDAVHQALCARLKALSISQFLETSRRPSRVALGRALGSAMCF